MGGELKMNVSLWLRFIMLLEYLDKVTKRKLRAKKTGENE